MFHGVVRFVITAVCLPKMALSQAPAHRPPGKPAPSAPVQFVLAPAGNVARFIVREKLLANTIENDAIGNTTAISGGIVLDAHGKVDPAASKFTIQLDSLKSDESRRDRYVKANTLETRQFPMAVLVIKELQGLPATLPASGTMHLTILGDFTVHGVTKPSAWTAVVTADGSGFSGRATTHVKFEEFNMNQPSVPLLAHLNDDIRLEYDFHFVRQ